MIRKILNKIKQRKKIQERSVAELISIALITLVVLSVLLIIFLWGTVFSSFKQVQNSKKEMPAMLNPDDSLKIDNSDHTYGGASASVSIIEYVDFECEFCAQMHPVLKQLVNEYAGRVSLTFRHFPITSIHPRAAWAAEAAECAGEQGKFFEFSEQLFLYQRGLSGALYSTLAQQLDLHLDDFTDCMNSGRMKQKIKKDTLSAMKLEVRGTPTVFINGMPLYGVVSQDVLRAAIENALR